MSSKQSSLKPSASSRNGKSKCRYLVGVRGFFTPPERNVDGEEDEAEVYVDGVEFIYSDGSSTKCGQCNENDSNWMSDVVPIAKGEHIVGIDFGDANDGVDDTYYDSDEEEFKSTRVGYRTEQLKLYTTHPRGRVISFYYVDKRPIGKDGYGPCVGLYDNSKAGEEFSCERGMRIIGIAFDNSGVCLITGIEKEQIPETQNNKWWEAHVAYKPWEELEFSLDPNSDYKYLAGVRGYYHKGERILDDGRVIGVELMYSDGTSTKCGNCTGDRRSEIIPFEKNEHIIGIDYSSFLGSMSQITLYTSHPSGRMIVFREGEPVLMLGSGQPGFRNVYADDKRTPFFIGVHHALSPKGKEFTCKHGERVAGIEWTEDDELKMIEEMIPKGQNHKWWEKSLGYKSSASKKAARKGSGDNPYVVGVRACTSTTEFEEEYIVGLELKLSKGPSMKWGKVQGTKKSSFVSFEKNEHIVGIDFLDTDEGVMELELYTSHYGGRCVTFSVSFEDGRVEACESGGHFIGMYGDAKHRCNLSSKGKKFTCKQGNRVTGINFEKGAISSMMQEEIPKGANDRWWDWAMDYNSDDDPQRENKPKAKRACRRRLKRKLKDYSLTRKTKKAKACDNTTFNDESDFDERKQSHHGRGPKATSNSRSPPTKIQSSQMPNKQSSLTLKSSGIDEKYLVGVKGYFTPGDDEDDVEVYVDGVEFIYSDDSSNKCGQCNENDSNWMSDVVSIAKGEHIVGIDFEDSSHSYYDSDEEEIKSRGGEYRTTYLKLFTTLPTGRAISFYYDDNQPIGKDGYGPCVGLYDKSNAGEGFTCERGMRAIGIVFDEEGFVSGMEEEQIPETQNDKWWEAHVAYKPWEDLKFTLDPNADYKYLAGARAYCSEDETGYFDRFLIGVELMYSDGTSKKCGNCTGDRRSEIVPFEKDEHIIGIDFDGIRDVDELTLYTSHPSGRRVDFSIVKPGDEGFGTKFGDMCADAKRTPFFIGVHNSVSRKDIEFTCKHGDRVAGIEWTEDLYEKISMIQEKIPKGQNDKWWEKSLGYNADTSVAVQESDNDPYVMGVRACLNEKEYIVGLELVLSDGPSIKWGKVVGTKKSSLVSFERNEHIVGIDFINESEGVISLDLYTSHYAGRNVTFSIEIESPWRVKVFEVGGSYIGIYGDASRRNKSRKGKKFTCRRGNRVSGITFEDDKIVSMAQENIPTGENERWWEWTMDYNPELDPEKQSKTKRKVKSRRKLKNAKLCNNKSTSDDEASFDEERSGFMAKFRREQQIASEMQRQHEIVNRLLQESNNPPTAQLGNERYSQILGELRTQHQLIDRLMEDPSEDDLP